MSLLVELVRYADRKQLIAEPGFKPATARWAVDISGEGKLLRVIAPGDQERKRDPGLDFPACPRLEQAELTGGSEMGRRSQFLLDSASVVALYGGRTREGAPMEVEDEKARAKHEYFVRLLREASSAMPCLAAAADCLSEAQSLARIRAELAEHGAGPLDNVTVRIDGQFPLQSDAWHGWWREFRARFRQELPREQRQAGQRMRCFISGEVVQPARTHPKIRLADVGGQKSGCALVSFKPDSFRSGGLQQSANFAVSEEAAWAYTAALNHLLERAVTLVGAKVAYWFDEDVAPEDDPIAALMSGEQEELEAHERARKLLTAIRTGERPDLRQNAYYAVTLSGNAGRAVVRDWMHGRFEDLAASVDAWFSDLQIVPIGRTVPALPPKFNAVLGALLRPKQNFSDLPAPFASRLWRVAVQNEPIPRAALSAALARVRTAVMTDEAVRTEAIGLIKAYHIRKARTSRKEGGAMPEDFTPYLNPDHPDPAYHCGRLMAVYAQLQQAALGGVGAGVVQRYYAAASAMPALIFGRLARLSMAHLGKLDKGLARWYEQRLADIWARIRDRVPRVLDLEGQSLFALGYYQQLADLWTKKTEVLSGDQSASAEDTEEPGDEN